MNIQYIAGHFDGEGTIGLYITPGSRDPRYRSGRREPCWVRVVSVVGCYAPTIEGYGERFGGAVRKRLREGPRRCRWEWTIGAVADIDEFLSTVLPHLREKYEQAELMLRAIHGEVDMHEAAAKLRALKKVEWL